MPEERRPGDVRGGRERSPAHQTTGRYMFSYGGTLAVHASGIGKAEFEY